VNDGNKKLVPGIMRLLDEENVRFIPPFLICNRLEDSPEEKLDYHLARLDTLWELKSISASLGLQSGYPVIAKNQGLLPIADHRKVAAVNIHEDLGVYLPSLSSLWAAPIRDFGSGQLIQRITLTIGGGGAQE
jgi:hypothetical protein